MMQFPIRQYSKGRINRAGNELIEDRASDETFAVINNWKSCHSYPLQVIKMTLKNRAKEVEESPLIAQRMKRLPSIAIKLRRNPQMELSQMQDLGGCRAVLRNIENVDSLIDMYKEGRLKTPSKSEVPRDRPVWTEEDDYISKPKADGYRGYHLIYRYYSKARDKRPFNGQRIEIQIRSKLQHMWATAVEVAETFSGQALKSKIRPASQAWERFFVLMGSVFALREKRPLVPNTPTTRQELVKELKIVLAQEQILDCLSGWGSAVQLFHEELKGADTFLLKLNIRERVLSVKPFQKDNYETALQKYDEEERRFANNPMMQIVLVRVDSITALERAYPNYYVDTGAFVKEVSRLTGD